VPPRLKEAIFSNFSWSEERRAGHYVVQENGRVIETDATGNKQYHKQQYVIKDRNVYPTDSLGRIQYNTPSLTVQRKK